MGNERSIKTFFGFSVMANLFFLIIINIYICIVKPQIGQLIDEICIEQQFLMGRLGLHCMGLFNGTINVNKYALKNT